MGRSDTDERSGATMVQLSLNVEPQFGWGWDAWRGRTRIAAGKSPRNLFDERIGLGVDNVHRLVISIGEVHPPSGAVHATDVERVVGRVGDARHRNERLENCSREVVSITSSTSAAAAGEQQRHNDRA